MERHRLVLAISITFTALAAVLTGAALTSGTRLDMTSAAAAVIITALLWVGLWVVITREKDDRQRDQLDEETRHVLIRKLAYDAAPARLRSLAATLPLPRPALFRAR